MSKKLKDSPVDHLMRRKLKTLRVDDTYRAQARARQERKSPEEREAEWRRHKEDRDEVRTMLNHEADAKRVKWMRGLFGLGYEKK